MGFKEFSTIWVLLIMTFLTIALLGLTISLIKDLFGR